MNIRTITLIACVYSCYLYASEVELKKFHHEKESEDSAHLLADKADAQKKLSAALRTTGVLSAEYQKAVQKMLPKQIAQPPFLKCAVFKQQQATLIEACPEVDFATAAELIWNTPPQSTRTLKKITALSPHVTTWATFALLATDKIARHQSQKENCKTTALQEELEKLWCSVGGAEKDASYHAQHIMRITSPLQPPKEKN